MSVILKVISFPSGRLLCLRSIAFFSLSVLCSSIRHLLAYLSMSPPTMFILFLSSKSA